MTVLVRKLTISNYKSFLDPQSLEFAEGFNLVIGANCTGKSSVLDAMPWEISDSPHISPATVPGPLAGPSTPHSSSTVLIQATWAELRWLAQGTKIYIPAGQGWSSAIAERVSQFVSSPSIEIKVSRSGGNAQMELPQTGHQSPLQLGAGLSQLASCVDVDAQGNLTAIGQLANYSAGQPENLFNPFWQRIGGFFFKLTAHRLPPDQSGIAGADALERTGHNLADCLLSVFTRKKSEFERYVSLVNQVLPSVRWVSVDTTGGTAVIKAWPVGEATGNYRYAVRLDLTGTGVKQVLAILYAAMFAETQKVIAIDEPSSYLHPRAVRNLLGILQDLPIKHQYILTTHSPDVIRAVEPSRINVLTLDGQVTRARAISGGELHQCEADLGELGVRLTDLQGADRIFWVEGQTEELVVPALLPRVDPLRDQVTVVKAVRATGDFEGSAKSVKRLFDIYERLVAGYSLVPPALGFLFDAEGRAEAKRKELEQLSAGKLRFLRRRMFECYALNPAAIDSVVATLDSVTPTKMGFAAFVETKGLDKTYLHARHASNATRPLTQCDAWIANVHAAKLLNDYFHETVGRSYGKTTDGVQIFRWLIERQPDYLEPLVVELRDAIEAWRLV